MCSRGTKSEHRLWLHISPLLWPLKSRALPWGLYERGPESLREPCFLGNGCCWEQKEKLPPIHRRNGKHWLFVFCFIAVNIIWPKVSAVCIILHLPEYYEHVHTLRFVPGLLCSTCPTISFLFLHPSHHKQRYLFRGVWRKDSLRKCPLPYQRGMM